METPVSLARGRYRIERPLGKGGTAAVYEARDTELNTVVAIKLVFPGGAQRAALRARLKAETVAMQRVKHRNVLRVHTYDSDGDFDYVVMDLAPGGSLQDRLDDEGALPIEVAVGYTQQILAALAAAHLQGVIHRDVKPHNVLLDRDGVALLADFGIALLLQDELRADRRTRAGIAMGSFAYMPPEQRIDAHEVTQTADIYAAGATLYALLTAGNPVDLFTAGVDSVRWTGIPRPLVDVIRRSTHHDAGERYPDAAAFGRELDAALAMVPEAARSAPIIFYPSEGRGTTAIVSRDAWVRATREAVTFLFETPSAAAASAPTGDWPDHTDLGMTLDPVAPTRAAATGASPGSWGHEPEARGTRVPEEPPTAAPGNAGSKALVALGLVGLSVGVVLYAARLETRTESPQVVAGPAPEAPAPSEHVSPVAVQAASAAPALETPPPEGPGPVAALVAGAAPAGPAARVRAAPVSVVSGVERGVAGSWKGSFGGRVIKVQLRGAGGSVSGTTEVASQFLDANDAPSFQRTEVEGRWEPASGVLVLRDISGSTPGTYQLTYSPSDQLFQGQFVSRGGSQQVVVILKR